MGKGFLIFLALLVGPVAVAQNQDLAVELDLFWQLTFSYNETGISLLRASPFHSHGKPVNAPGIRSAKRMLDYSLEWLDENGQKVDVSPVAIPVSFFSEQADKEDGVFVLRVAATKARAVSFRLAKKDKALKLQAPKGFKKMDATFSLYPAPPPSQPTGTAITLEPKPLFSWGGGGPVGSSKVLNNGTDVGRLVLVFMGDGYISAELPVFQNQVSQCLQYMQTQVPWSTYWSQINAYRVDIGSVESGTDTFASSKDTYLNSNITQHSMGIPQLGSEGMQRAYAAADQYVGVGVWDDIVVFVNGSNGGGVNMGNLSTVGVLSGATDQTQQNEINGVTLHELGHGIGGLGEEYVALSSSVPYAPWQHYPANNDLLANVRNLKWKYWISPGTPLPTPNSCTYTGIGGFEGALYLSGMVRPSFTCVMNSSRYAPYCTVCRESVVNGIINRSGLMASLSPDPGTVYVPSGDRVVFTATAGAAFGPHCSYRWTLRDQTLGTSPGISISSLQLHNAYNTLTLEVAYSSPLLRARRIQSYSWSIRVAPVEIPSAGSTVLLALHQVYERYAMIGNPLLESTLDRVLDIRLNPDLARGTMVFVGNINGDLTHVASLKESASGKYWTNPKASIPSGSACYVYSPDGQLDLKMIGPVSTTATSRKLTYGYNYITAPLPREMYLSELGIAPGPKDVLGAVTVSQNCTYNNGVWSPDPVLRPGEGVAIVRLSRGPLWTAPALYWRPPVATPGALPFTCIVKPSPPNSDYNACEFFDIVGTSPYPDPTVRLTAADGLGEALYIDYSEYTGANGEFTIPSGWYYNAGYPPLFFRVSQSLPQ